MSNLPAAALKFFREQGRKGGKKSAATRNQRLSAERRADIARKAAAARWRKPSQQ